MKKLMIALIALTTLAIFVACNPAKDPVKDNLAIGNWEGEYGDEPNKSIIALEVKDDKTATMVVKNSGVSETVYFEGTWTASSISEGSITLVETTLKVRKLDGLFKVESNMLTITPEAGEETIELKKAVK